MYVVGKLAAKMHLIPTVVFDGKDRKQIEVMEKHHHVLAIGWSVRFPELFQKYKRRLLNCSILLLKYETMWRRSWNPQTKIP
jgi:hypothetical protein